MSGQPDSWFGESKIRHNFHLGPQLLVNYTEKEQGTRALLTAKSYTKYICNVAERREPSAFFSIMLKQHVWTYNAYKLLSASF